MNTAHYSVPNIHCHHCVHTIKTELSDLQGVKTVDVDMMTKEITVEFEPPATPREIESLLADINYPAAK